MVKELQLLNADKPTDVTLDGAVNDSRLVHPLNTVSGSAVMVFAMIIFLRAVNPVNGSIVVVPSLSIVTVSITFCAADSLDAGAVDKNAALAASVFKAAQLFSAAALITAPTGKSSDETIVPLNASNPTEVIESGIVTLASELQPENKVFGISVTPSLITKLGRDEQLTNDVYAVIEASVVRVCNAVNPDKFETTLEAAEAPLSTCIVWMIVLS